MGQGREAVSRGQKGGADAIMHLCQPREHRALRVNSNANNGLWVVVMYRFIMGSKRATVTGRVAVREAVPVQG